jgi:hypothetical protein
MAVAVSFVCLVGVVVMTKLRRDEDDGKNAGKVANAKDAKPGNGVDNPPNQPPTKKSPVQPAEFKFQPLEPNSPVRLPEGNVGESSSSNPPAGDNPPIAPPLANMNTPVLPPPPVAASQDVPPLPMPVASNPPPGVPTETDDAKRNKLLEQSNKLLDVIAKDQKQREANAALPPLPGGGVFDKAEEAQNKGSNAIEKSFNKGNDFARKGIDDPNNRFPKNDAGLNPSNNTPTPLAQATPKPVEGLFNKDNAGFNKGFDNAGKQMTLPGAESNSALPPLPSNKENANPMIPAVPALPSIENKQPVIPAPKDNGLPMITNTGTNNPTFVIPQAKPNEPVVVQYDIKSHVARQGDSFASLSRDYYKSDAYANALQAYNREWSKDRNMAALQPGQTVLLPALQVLQQDRYARAVADVRPPIGAAAVSINPPVPVNQYRPLTPSTPTSDATKNFRIPVGGQKIYELAIQTMGDGSRWTEIYRLNPTIDPLQPIPGNTVVRLPANANVP